MINAQKDMIWLLGELPSTLYPIISAYNPFSLFILSREIILNYNWRQLIKVNFGLDYEDHCTNNEMLSIYHNLCYAKPRKISCDGLHTIFKKNNGTLIQCGLFSSPGDKFSTEFKKIVELPRDIVEVACGPSHTVIRRANGILMGFGSNDRGNLGLGDKQRILSFEEIHGIPTDIVEIACGNNFTMIRRMDGTLMSTGSNFSGELGLGELVCGYKFKFEEIKGLPRDIVEISCGESHVIIRRANGILMGCGCNKDGQLGLVDKENRYLFTEIKGLPSDIIQVNCQGMHSIIKRLDGTLMSCGNNTSGQLGLGHTRNISIFEEIKGIPRDIIGIALGYYHSVILRTNGILLSCGSNSHGELGNGQFPNYQTTFQEINKVPKDIVEVACGCRHTVIMQANSTLMSCGDNGFGQLGRATFLTIHSTFHEINIL
jgi:alpha-tubulin suppressor-like RCC1 family protein